VLVSSWSLFSKMMAVSSAKPNMCESVHCPFVVLWSRPVILSSGLHSGPVAASLALNRAFFWFFPVYNFILFNIPRFFWHQFTRSMGHPLIRGIRICASRISRVPLSSAALTRESTGTASNGGNPVLHFAQQKKGV
jgi:hypothetical protein